MTSFSRQSALLWAKVVVCCLFRNNLKNLFCFLDGAVTRITEGDILSKDDKKVLQTAVRGGWFVIVKAAAGTGRLVMRASKN
jgi:hypothetical protein